MTGTLTLIVGPSGAGKDTLIGGAKAALAGQWRFVFPLREITRPAGDRSESHIPITEAQFAERQARGAYALSWRAHGLGYGVPRGIEDALAAGRTVVVNASRSMIPQARQRFSPLAVVAVSAPERLLQRRLATRGRERNEDIASRLRRATAFDLDGPDVTTLINDTSPERAVAAFLRCLQELRSAAA